MSEERRRWNPAQRETIRRRSDQAAAAGKLVLTALFGTNRAVKRVVQDAIGDVRERREAARLRDGAIVVEGEPSDEEDE